MLNILKQWQWQLIIMGLLYAVIRERKTTSEQISTISAEQAHDFEVKHCMLVSYMTCSYEYSPT